MNWNSSIKQFWNVSSTKNIVWQYYQLVLESHCRLVNRQLTKTTNDKTIVCSPLVYLALLCPEVIRRPGAPETRLDCVFPVTSGPYTSDIHFMSRFFQYVISWLLNILTVLEVRFYYVCWQFVPCIHHSLRNTVFPNIGSWVFFIYLMLMSSCTWFISRKYRVTVHFGDVVNYLIGFYQVRSHSSVLQWWES